MKPQIIVPYDPGAQNADIAKANARLTRSKSYKDLSTVIVTPTRGGRSLCPRFVSSIMGLLRPMNQPCVGPIFMSGMEVGAAWNAAVEMILANPQLSKFRYLFCVEDDNLLSPDALLKLYESIEDYDAVGGLYWTKGEMGAPMIYGSPNVSPLNFVPQQVIPETVQRCNGLGMGATLIRLDVFRRLDPPYFETKQSYDPNTGSKSYTQDLWFFERIAKLGMKVACDTRVRVGHHDPETGETW